MKKLTKKVISLSFLFLFLAGNIFSQAAGQNQEIQENQQNQLSENESENSALTENLQNNDEENDGKKHWFAAFGGMLIFNLGLSSYNRWVLGSGWAQTGWEEWDHFWERELKWDDDWYWTNFVLHPYQGSLYYMSARGSNLNAFESMIVTTIGSGIWEYLCETNAPSKNDMVYTTVGAFAVGEMLYRLSCATDGKSRAAGFIINPMRLWTEFATRQKPKNPHGNIYELSFRANAGSTFGHTAILGSSPRVNKDDFDRTEVYPIHAGIDAYVVYNDPYTNDSNTPYNQFELRFAGNVGKGSGTGSDCAFKDLDKLLMYNIEVESNGMLWSRSPVFAENVDTTLGLVMEYDFDWHSYYLLTSLAPGLAIKQRVNFDTSRFEWQLHGAWVCLGTADNYYMRRGLTTEEPEKTNRFYSYTTGVETVLKLKYATDKGSNVSFDFHGYAMYDFYNQLKRGGATGWEYIGKGTLAGEIAVSKSILLGISDRVYVKRTCYRIYPDVFQILNSASVYARWKLR